jgi:hypothetical protein
MLRQQVEVSDLCAALDFAFDLCGAEITGIAFKLGNEV